MTEVARHKQQRTDLALLSGFRHTSHVAREKQRRMLQEDPELWSELRLEHNAILREWSYRGTTFVNGIKHRGVEKKCLTKITRASREAALLPPLFQHTPDLRQTRRQWSNNRDYKGQIRHIIETLNPKTHSHPRVDPGIEVAKVLGDKLRGSLTAQIDPEPEENEEDLNVTIDQEIGILFCEEILKASESGDGPDKILQVFERMDIDSNNQLSILGLATFFRSVGLRIDSRDVTSIFKYFKNAGDIIDDSPEHFAKQTRQLMNKYEKARKAFFFSAHADNIAEAERYFQRQTLHVTRPRTGTTTAHIPLLRILPTY